MRMLLMEVAMRFYAIAGVVDQLRDKHDFLNLLFMLFHTARYVVNRI